MARPLIGGGVAVLTTVARSAHLVATILVGAAISIGGTGSVGGPPRSGSVGYDVGDLSCSAALPSGGAFAVVGATAGQPFHRSHCLASEYAWAKEHTYRPQFYVNLADPGHKSAHWGKGGPQRCHRKPKYDVGCAYDYGFEAAATALQYVKSVGSSGHGRWWIDVEIDNSWGSGRAGTAANIADIKGALHYLRPRSHTSAGVYTETTWWSSITEGEQLAHTFVWGGGANNKHHARENCRAHSITGGPALMAQWIDGTVDHDYAC